MKLKDYFQIQKDIHINTNDKFLMYEKILSKQQKIKPIRRFLNVKSFAYGFMSVILLIGIYGLYLFQNDLSYDNIIIQDSTMVSADYIAKIIDFDGTFYVSHDNKIYKTTKILNGDSVILKKGAEILFTINSGTKAKLSGPARFSISNNSGTYQLILAEGDYLQMESTNTGGDSMEIILNDDIKISSTNNLDLLITKSNSGYQINNQGDKIHVTTKNKAKEVAPQQLLAIKENDITIIENVEDFKIAFTNQKVNQTFQIKETEKSPDETISAIKDITSNKDTYDKQETQNSEEIAKELGVLNDKKIPTQDQINTIYKTLNKNSLLLTIESMYKSQIAGNTKDTNFYRDNLYSKVQEIYKTFNIKFTKNNILADIQTLKSTLENDYHIPNTQLNNLTILGNWITYIQSQSVLSFDDDSKIEESWDNLINNLPSNLIFN